MTTNKTQIMGILNFTPDSFSDGGQYFNERAACKHVGEMLAEGADIVDVGGESTRPGSTPVPMEEELRRVIPIIKAIRQHYGNDFLISIDTYKSQVARAAIEAGATIINDIGGLTLDPRMAAVAAELQVPTIISHIRGTPQTMQVGEIIYEDVVEDVKAFLSDKAERLKLLGLPADKIIIDPGIGFGKTLEHNVALINRLAELRVLGYPILLGLSRKKFIGMLLQQGLGLDVVPEATDRLEGALAMTGLAVQNGATIIRTHDVAATRRYLTVLDLALPTSSRSFLSHHQPDL